MNKEEIIQPQWHQSFLPAVATLNDLALSLTKSALGFFIIYDDEKSVGTLPMLISGEVCFAAIIFSA